MAGRLMRIGEAARLAGLSVRTVRHYEDVGVVVPASRRPGGFRLYAQADVRRLSLARRMRLLGFGLRDIRALLAVLDGLPPEQHGVETAAPAAEQTREELVDMLRSYWVAADARCEELRRELAAAEQVARSLHIALARAVAGPGAAVPGTVAEGAAR
ncbi:MerR family transcriptional regulator [Streptomyces sp. YIM 98790]|uniref:MerR family transcriptional regulator n=1 Tax=Streptomyces sp. YIM 98790 TaxID=2689077 RepID=UPI00140E7518|nr:MerR family transcriptional regulator [Streptomyces sp. YIM 98790]